MAYKPSRSPALKLWSTFGGHRAGRWLVSRIVCFVAPYFRTIRPVFTVMQPGHVEVRFRKRRAVQNHIKSVHAIAMCNAAELAGGTCMDISLHADFRWIPVGMEVNYLKIARTDLTAVCRIEDYRWEEARDVVLPVRVFDTQGTEVFNAAITMRISARS
jgi:acyl-coenzyme A thioesterase PaaI-like protein